MILASAIFTEYHPRNIHAMLFENPVATFWHMQIIKIFFIEACGK